MGSRINYYKYLKDVKIGYRRIGNIVVVLKIDNILDEKRDTIYNAKRARYFTDQAEVIDFLYINGYVIYIDKIVDPINPRISLSIGKKIASNNLDQPSCNIGIIKQKFKFPFWKSFSSCLRNTELPPTPWSGMWKYFDSEGRLLHSCRYINSKKRQGLAAWFYPNGYIYKIIFYDLDGKVFGEEKIFDKNGGLETKRRKLD